MWQIKRSLWWSCSDLESEIFRGKQPDLFTWYEAEQLVWNTKESAQSIVTQNYCVKCKMYFSWNCSQCWYYPVMAHQTNGWPRLEEGHTLAPIVKKTTKPSIDSFQRRTNIDLSKNNLTDFSSFWQNRGSYQVEEKSGIEIDINNIFIDLNKREFTFAFRQDWEKLAVKWSFITDKINIQKWDSDWVSIKESTPKLLKWYEWSSLSKQFFTNNKYWYKLNKYKRIGKKKTTERIFDKNRLELCIKNILDQLLLEQSL